MSVSKIMILTKDSCYISTTKSMPVAYIDLLFRQGEDDIIPPDSLGKIKTTGATASSCVKLSQFFTMPRIVNFYSIHALKFV